MYVSMCLNVENLVLSYPLVIHNGCLVGDSKWAVSHNVPSSTPYSFLHLHTYLVGEFSGFSYDERLYLIIPGAEVWVG